MGDLSRLEPHRLWQYFEEICKIPRISKDEGRIRNYLLDFAEKHGLESKVDKSGNVLITRLPSPGMEKRKTVVLQSHMDMVGEKNSDHPHNWKTDPIKPVLKGGWVTASGTTLGADDGAGIAAQMAILTDTEIKAGKIECLFTTDEETGMTGAKNLSPGFFNGRTLINLDSEDEGILFIGCAGGIDTVGLMGWKSIPLEKGKAALSISLTGLHGGHSGDEIHKGYGNSVKLMNRLLQKIYEQSGFSLAWFNGGNLRNAIPREAFSLIVSDRSALVKIRKVVAEFPEILRSEFGELEKDLKIEAKEADLPQYVMDDISRQKLMQLIEECPHGVVAWSKEMEDLVETSTNLASVNFEGGNKIRIVTTQRSSKEQAKKDIAHAIEQCMKKAGAEVTHSEGYPGWEPDLDSEILTITRNSYKDLFGKKPLVRAIHAGLECGLIYEKIKDIDMISFGPTIRGAHTPEEMIEVNTVIMFWDLLKSVLENIPDRN